MQGLPRLALPSKQVAGAAPQEPPTTRQDEPKGSMLVWHQLEAKSWTPAAKVGHRGDVVGKRLFVFGGLEGNVRGNQLLCFNVETLIWEKIDCIGAVPSARAWHASTVYSHYVFIHGGEGEASSDADQYKLFPGDDLDQVGYKITEFAGGAAQRACLDDLWILDTSRMSFRCVESQLAPLPRKHHSIAMADFEDSPHLFMFGGFSLERDTVSSGLFLVDVQSILGGRGTWRSAVTNGTPPAARQQHTMTALNENTLLILGGLSAQDKPLHDIVLLSTDTMTWTHPATSGARPTALFSHAAVAVQSQAGGHQLLVFGGAALASDKATHYSNKLHICDLNSFEWEQVNTGYMFPSPRFGHVLAVVDDWAPTNHAPSGQHLDSELDRESKSAAVLFGGMNYKFCKSETWALDLRWRKPGVEQFDGTQSQAIANELNGTVTRTARSMSLPSNPPIEEMPQLGNLTSTTVTGKHNGKFPNTFREFVQQHSHAQTHHVNSSQPAVSQDFAMQAKKETIVAHLEVNKERAMRIEAETRAAELTAAMEKLTQVNEALTKQHIDDNHQLRSALEQAHNRIRELETLNQEAYRLLQLLDARQTQELCENFFT